MHIQLAENGYGTGYVPPSMFLGERRFTYVRPYGRRANRVRAHSRLLSEYGGFQEDNPYVFIPDPSGKSRGVMVREDYFDDLNNVEWKILMQQLLPFQPQIQKGMSENYFLSARKERKEKRARKEEKKQAKVDKKKAKNEIKLARAQAKKEGRGAKVLDTVVGGLTSIFGKEDTATAPAEPTPAGRPSPDKESFWDKEIFGIKNKIAIPVGVVLVGALAFGGSRLLRGRKRK